MAASKKQTEEIREWFLAPRPHGFWAEYPAELCGGSRKKGSRGEALKAMIKINPDEKERKRILMNLQAQVKHDMDAKRRGEDVYRWPYATTYINQWRFDDTIDSVADQKPEVSLGICKHGDCGDECHGPEFEYCAKHIPEPSWLIKARKDSIAKVGLVWDRENETFHQFAMRCKDYCITEHGGMLKRITQ